MIRILSRGLLLLALCGVLPATLSACGGETTSNPFPDGGPSIDAVANFPDGSQVDAASNLWDGGTDAGTDAGPNG